MKVNTIEKMILHEITIMDHRGRIVIPKEFRDFLHIRQDGYAEIQYLKQIQKIILVPKSYFDDTLSIFQKEILYNSPKPHISPELNSELTKETALKVNFDKRGRILIPSNIRQDMELGANSYLLTTLLKEKNVIHLTPYFNKLTTKLLEIVTTSKIAYFHQIVKIFEELNAGNTIRNMIWLEREPRQENPSEIVWLVLLPIEISNNIIITELKDNQEILAITFF